MVGRHQGNGVADHRYAGSVEVVEPAAQSADGLLRAQQRLGSQRAQGADDFRLDDLQLLEEMGEQDAISSAAGVRLFGGRHLSTLQMNTSSRFSPMAMIILVSSCPARPTNASPCWSSS